MLRYCPIGMFSYQISGSPWEGFGIGMWVYGYIGILPKFMFMMDVALGTLPLWKCEGWGMVLHSNYIVCLLQLVWVALVRSELWIWCW